jgi:hypothetical protein
MAIIAQAVATALAVQKPERKSDHAKIKSAFEKAGYTDVVLYDPPEHWPNNPTYHF